jgi:hypothetical protein
MQLKAVVFILLEEKNQKGCFKLHHVGYLIKYTLNVYNGTQKYVRHQQK